MKKLMIVLLVAVAILAGYVLYFRLTEPALPNASEIESMTAFIGNSPQNLPDTPEFPVPAEQIPVIIDQLLPAESSNNHPMWQVLGRLRITCKNGVLIEVDLFWTKKATSAYYVRRGSRVTEFRGGTDKGIEDAVRAAYAAHLSTKK